MRTERLWLVVVVAVGCSGGPQRATSTPAPERAAQLVPIPNAVLFDGMLLGGEPTSEHLQQARDLGYKTVINLRTGPEVDEARKVVEALGMTFVHLPIHVPQGLNGENARALDRILAEHEGFFLIHCKMGERAAALMALRAACVDGKPLEDAIVVGRRAGLEKLEPKLRESMSAGCDARPPPPAGS